jgi:hypothetical protein
MIDRLDQLSKCLRRNIDIAINLANKSVTGKPVFQDSNIPIP